MPSRIISVSYGHGSPSGKLYDYETDKNYRTGDVVVVPVEHAKSHKLYNTLAVVQLTTDEGTAKWEQKADNLTDPNKDIRPKNVSQRLEIAQQQGLDVSSQRDVTVRTLPGYKTRESNEKWSTGSRLISRS
ncbi:hypothetical protein [uncultured Muribaculum sp.]|uniref:hypothetical protein n=1 Tax=uncultured Muribaculum sp. TaxID=1918613 RepID=UPI0032207345